MDFLLIFKVLMRRLWLIILLPGIAAVITFFVALNSEKVFKSTAQLSTGFTVEDAIKITDERFNPMDARTKFGNLIEKMNSVQVLSLVSYRLMLHDLEEGNQPFRSIYDDENNLVIVNDDARQKFTRILKTKYDSLETLSSFSADEKEVMDMLDRYEYDVETIKKNLQVYRVNLTDFVSVNFTSENPILSAYVVNALSDEIIRYERVLRANRSSESVEFFANLVRDKKAEVEARTLELNDFKKYNNVVDLKLENETKISQIAEYETMRDLEYKKVQGLLLSIRDVNDKLEGLTTVTTTENATNQKIIDLRKKIVELNKVYIDGGSTDKQLAATIDNLRDRLQVEINNISRSGSVADVEETKEELLEKRNSLNLELKIARSNLDSYNNNLIIARGSLSSTASKEGELSGLEKEVDRASEEYLQALNRYNTEKSKSLISGVEIKQILKGQPAGEPEPAKVMIKTALGFIISLFICILGVTVAEFLDFSIKSPVLFERITNLSLNGVLNNIKMEEDRLEFQRIFDDSTKDKDLNSFKQLLRKIRYEVENDDAKVYLVTSTESKVGKSYIIVCLAYSLSLIKKKVLIIDSNFRNNSLSQLLIRQPDKMRKLLGDGSYDQFFRDELMLVEDVHGGEHGNGKPSGAATTGYSLISKTAHKDIDIIGSKWSSESPSEILSGRDFGLLIDDLREHYDYIFMEGAALNDFSDTKELVNYVDRVIPVFSANSVIKSIDRESIRFLKNLNGKLSGAILNNVNLKILKI